MTVKKVFVEPEIVKYEKSLDKVTLWAGNCSGYNTTENPERYPT